MAIVPNDTRFIGINPTVNLRERRSARINRETQPVSMQDITDSVRPYKVYTAIVTAWDADAPVAIELENTIGTITITRLEEGRYLIYSDVLFVGDKTVIFYGSISKSDPYGSDPQLIASYENTSSISIYTFLDGVASDFVIWKTPIEIRVYN